MQFALSCPEREPKVSIVKTDATWGDGSIAGMGGSGRKPLLAMQDTGQAGRRAPRLAPGADGVSATILFRVRAR